MVSGLPILARRLEVVLDEPGRVAVTASLRARAASRDPAPPVLARWARTLRVPRAGARALTLRLTRRERARVPRRAALDLRIHLTATDMAGNVARRAGTLRVPAGGTR